MTWPGALVKSMSAAGSETYKAMAADLGCEVGRLQSRLPMLPAFDADSTVYRKIVQMASTTEHVKASGGIAQWRTATDQTCFGLMSSRKTGVEHTEEEAEDGREFPGLMTWSQKLSSCQSWLDDVYSAGYRRYTVAVAALWPSRRSRYKTEMFMKMKTTTWDILCTGNISSGLNHHLQIYYMSCLRGWVQQNV